MRLSLKFVLGYLIFGIAAFVLIATMSTSLTHSYLISSRSETLYDEASMISNTLATAYEGSKIEKSSIEPTLKATAAFLKSEIWIIDKSGTIKVDSSGTRRGQNVSGFNPAATGNKYYLTGDYFGSFPYEVLSVSSPIVANNKNYGYVVIHLPMSMVTQSQNQILDIVYKTSAIVFLLSFIILIVYIIFIQVPLKKITEAAKQYADGNLKYKCTVKSHDEMGYLSNTLNYMSDEMSKADEYQHAFVANVSHDFRSPLTSIKGFLEAILDGTIPPERQHIYIERVIGETERLTKLTQSMLALNSEDAQGFIHRTNFDINRVIKDTAQSFEVQCNNKNMTIELNFEIEQEMVHADHGKIQQVLYNLIDNAIKFSSKNSSIYISTSTRRDKVFVSVKDTGTGIPKKDQKKIFDRFYKSDASRGKDKRGTGLGLAIVKDIIQSHGENIDVISTEGVGTEFIFSLPMAVALEE